MNPTELLTSLQAPIVVRPTRRMRVIAHKGMAVPSGVAALSEIRVIAHKGMAEIEKGF